MPRTLLVADDSLTIQRVIKLALADENLEVVTVGSGTQAIEQIEALNPAIVLSDTRMPDRDGYEIAEFARMTPSGRQIPVVLMTGAFEPVDERRAEAAGCRAILVKPFEPQRLVDTVRELLGHPADPPPTPSPAASTLESAPPARAEDRVVRTPAAEPAGNVDLTWPVTDDLAAPSAQASGVSANPLVAPVTVTAPAPALDPGLLPATEVASAPIVITDELVERLATHVIARLSDRVVRETTTQIVTDVSERLVTAEIERIKSKLR